MDRLCLLTDNIVLGTDGLSNAVPRYTARAIVKNSEGLYGVMYAQKFNLYSLPGGGVEEGEDILTALRREIFEETGCACDCIEELGIVEENRFHADYTQINYYYVVTVSDPPKALHLTEQETENGTCVQWHRFEEMSHLIAEPVQDTPQRKFLQARDVIALKDYAARAVRLPRNSI